MTCFLTPGPDPSSSRLDDRLALAVIMLLVQQIFEQKRLHETGGCLSKSKDSSPAVSYISWLFLHSIVEISRVKSCVKKAATFITLAIKENKYVVGRDEEKRVKLWRKNVFLLQSRNRKEKKSCFEEANEESDETGFSSDSLWDKFFDSTEKSSLSSKSKMTPLLPLLLAASSCHQLSQRRQRRRRRRRC